MRTMRKWLSGLMVLSMGIAVAQQASANVVITFSDAGAWTADGNMGSYNDKSYAEEGWLIEANDAVRETDAARRIGTYAMRLRGSVMLAQNTVADTYTGFQIRIRPWSTSEPNAANPFTLEYSVNGGDAWTLVSGNIIGDDPLDWIIFAETFDATEFAIGQFQVRLSSTPAATQRVTVGQLTAFSAEPSLTPEPISLAGFAYLEGSGPSGEQSYTLSGSNLGGAGNITVSASTGFEVSLTSGSGFETSVNVPFASEQITGQPVTIYVRMAAGLAAGAAAGTIGHTGGGVTEAVEVAVSGEVVPAPPSGTLAYYTFTIGSMAPDFVAAEMGAENFAISGGTLGTGTANPDDWAALGATIPYAQGTGGYTNTTQAAAKYFLVEMEADAGKSITITNISFLHRRTPAGPQTVGVSINDSSVYVGLLEDATVELVDIPVTDYENLTGIVSVKIQGWDGGGGNHRVDNVIIQGFVDGEGPGPDPDPEQAEITGFTRSGADFVITFTGEVGATYQLEYTADLTNPESWIGGPQGSSGSLTDVAPDAPVRFYRLIDLGDN